MPGEGESAAAGNAESGQEKFPDFQGKDLDGKEVNSSELFSGNTVTVVNFWFTTCKPCVGELADLRAGEQRITRKLLPGRRQRAERHCPRSREMPKKQQTCIKS